MDIGPKIREFRLSKGLSMRQVAENCGISASMMSQIETGKVDPSLSTLRKIALALDVPLFYLVMDDSASPSRLVKPEQRRKVSFPKAGLYYDIIHSDLQKKMGIMIGSLKPGGATSEEKLAHEGEECLIVLDGALVVETARERIKLGVGDSLYFDSSVPHRLVNEDSTACRFYLIISPPKF